MKTILLTIVTIIFLGATFVVADYCESLCVYHRTPGVCGVSVDKNTRQHYRFFQNYCDLRKNNCRHPHDRYQAEIDLEHCPGHEIRN